MSDTDHTLEADQEELDTSLEINNETPEVQESLSTTEEASTPTIAATTPQW